jgi:hypothetical protein
MLAVNTPQLNQTKATPTNNVNSPQNQHPPTPKLKHSDSAHFSIHETQTPNDNSNDNKNQMPIFMYPIPFQYFPLYQFHSQNDTDPQLQPQFYYQPIPVNSTAQYLPYACYPYPYPYYDNSKKSMSSSSSISSFASYQIPLPVPLTQPYKPADQSNSNAQKECEQSDFVKKEDPETHSTPTIPDINPAMTEKKEQKRERNKISAARLRLKKKVL